jgi:cysteine desulfurase
MRIYFDHNATTPVDPGVLDVVVRTLRDEFGNPSSVHHFGQRAKAVLDDARSAVSALLGGEPSEVVFTSGGTEADNFALRGAAEALEQTGRKHLIATTIEHEAVLVTLKALARRGWKTTMLPVDATGIVAADALRDAITAETAIVSVMHANNEIGTVQPVAELAKIAHDHGALFHTDAVQSAGKIRIDVRALGVDLVSVSAHKFYGPKGVGALWIKRGTRLGAILTGGKHERSRRAGTENVAGIAGFGAAAEAALRSLQADIARTRGLRDSLEADLKAATPDVVIFGDGAERLPNTSLFALPGIKAETAIIAFDLEGVALSSGAACSSGKVAPSHVLVAMGVARGLTEGAIRVSLGPATTEADLERFRNAWKKLSKSLGKERNGLAA